MHRRYLPIFDYISSNSEIRFLIEELKKIIPCVGYTNNKPIYSDYVYCYEKQVGKSDISIKAFINYPVVDIGEKMINASTELMNQRIWFTCDDNFKFSAVAATLPEYRETIGVNLKQPLLVYHSDAIPVLSCFD